MYVINIKGWRLIFTKEYELRGKKRKRRKEKKCLKINNEFRWQNSYKLDKKYFNAILWTAKDFRKIAHCDLS